MKISIILEALTGTFETDIKRARKTAEKEFKQLKKDAAEAGKVIGAAVAAGAVAVGYAVKTAIDHLDDLGAASKALGISAEEFSKLEHAARGEGIEFQQLQATLEQLNKASAQAARGSLKQRDAFDALHIAYKNADGSLKTADQTFREIAQAFAGMEDGAEKAALAQVLLGSSWSELIPLMNQGTAGLDAAAVEAERFGLVVTDEATAAADHFNETLSKLGGVAEGVGVQLAAQLLPALNDLADDVLAMASDPAFIKGVADALAGIGKAAVACARGLQMLVGLTRGVGEAIAGAVGGVAADTLPGINKQLDILQRRLDGLAAGHGGDTPQARELRAEIARLQELKALYTDLERDKVRAGRAEREGGGAAPGATEPAKTPGPTLRDRRAEREAAAAAAKDEAAAVAAARDLERDAARERSEREREHAQAIEAVAALRLGTLDAEAQAVAQLQAKYIELQNAVAAGAISEGDAAELSATLADQWADAQREANDAKVEALMEGLLTEEELQARSYEKRRTDILTATVLTEQQRQTALERLAKQEQERQQEKTEAQADTLAEFAKEAARNAQDALSQFLFDPFSDGLDGMVKGLVDTLRRLAAEALAAKIFQTLGGMLGGSSAGGGGGGGFLATALSIGKSFFGPKDAGGSIPAGRFALVGERRPELVSGPATVTSGARTQALLSQAAGAGGDARPTKNVIVFSDDELAAALSGSSAMERVTVTHVRRNRRQLGI